MSLQDQINAQVVIVETTAALLETVSGTDRFFEVLCELEKHSQRLEELNKAARHAG